MRKYPEPNWVVWSLAHKAKLREAISISVNIDPRFMFAAGHGLEHLHRTHRKVIEFGNRVEVCLNNLDNNGPLKPSNTLALGFTKDRLEVPVLLSDFGAFAEACSWVLPKKFPRNAKKLEVSSSFNEPQIQAAGVANRLKELVDENERLKAENRLLKEGQKELGERSFSTAARLCYGLAASAFSADSISAKSLPMTEIIEDLRRHGVEVKEDAIRRYLRAGQSLKG